jgi:hypothetical protein
MNGLGVVFYVIHCPDKCRSRSESCKQLNDTTRRELTAAGFDVLQAQGDVLQAQGGVLQAQGDAAPPGSDRNASRLKKHLLALRAASERGHMALVMEDDTVVLKMIAEAVDGFSRSPDDVWYLTPSCSAYLCKSSAAAKLTTYYDRARGHPASARALRQLMIRDAAALCLLTRAVGDVCEDGSNTGAAYPTVTPNKRRLSAGGCLHPSTVVDTMLSLQRRGHVVQAYSEGMRAVTELYGSADTCGDTVFTQTLVGLFSGGPEAMCHIAASHEKIKFDAA